MFLAGGGETSCILQRGRYYYYYAFSLGLVAASIVVFQLHACETTPLHCCVHEYSRRLDWIYMKQYSSSTRGMCGLLSKYALQLEQKKGWCVPGQGGGGGSQWNKARIEADKLR